MTGRLLALSYTMPPLVLPRSLQVSRLLKALDAQGWKSTVVTVLPDAEPDVLQDHVLERLYAAKYRARTIEPRETAIPSPFWLRLVRRIRGIEEFSADNWTRRAGSALRSELAREHYDVIITFAQPWIDHLVGLRVKRRYQTIPWVAHFSDPWVDSPYLHFENEEQEREARKAERQVIEVADSVVFVTKETAELVMTKYPTSWRSKVAVVPHGYDEDILGLLGNSRARSEKFRIVHTGSFYGNRGPQAVLQALTDLARDAEIRRHLSVEFVGYVGPESVPSITDHGLDDIVTFHGKRRYVESLQFAADADLLLLIDAPAERSVFLPSKIVDYLMLRRPILGITPTAGASAEFLRRLGCSVVPPDNVQAIAASLRNALERWKKGAIASPIPEPAVAKMSDIRYVAAGFVQNLERVISAKQALQ